MDWAGLEFRVHRIGEVDHLVGGQAVEQLIIGLDKGGLLGLIGLSRQAFRALVFEAQAMHHLDAARMAVDHSVGRLDMGRHLAGIAVKPLAQMGRKLRLLLPAQMARPAMPVEQRHFIQAARTVALQPRPHRVVVEVEHLRHLDAAQAVIQEQNGVRAARHPVGLARMPHHRLQGRAFLDAQKSTANHDREKNRSAAQLPELFRVCGESGYIMIKFLLTAR